MAALHLNKSAASTSMPAQPKARLITKACGNKLANLDESQNANNSCFMRNRLDLNTSVPCAIMSKIERNYSYIEAMKEDLPVWVKASSTQQPQYQAKCDTLPNNYPGFLSSNHHEINQKKSHMFGKYVSASPSTTSPSTSSSASSTASSHSLSQQHIKRDANTKRNVNPNEASLNQSNLSKSASQSSILAIFKNTFSPFAIRKWRSKSRDKLASKSEQSPNLSSFINTSFSNNNNNNNNNNSTIEITTKQTPPSYTSPLSSKYQKNQQTASALKTKQKIQSKKQPVTTVIAAVSSDTTSASSSSSASVSSFTLNSNTLGVATAPPSPPSQVSPLPPAPAPAPARQLLDKEPSQIIMSYLNLSPRLEPERQKSERIKLTCLLNGYETSGTHSDASDMMKAAGDILDGSERFYNLKKKPSISPRAIQVAIAPVEAKQEVDVIAPIQIIALTTNPSTTDSNSNTTTSSETQIKDGAFYMALLDQHTCRLNELCSKFSIYTDQNDTANFVTNEDSLGQIQTAIGKAQLLINQKFKQFRGLCVKNLKDKNEETVQSEGEFVTRDDDLAGFWDMVYLQIEDLEAMFKELDEMKENNWTMKPKPKPKPATKKTTVVKKSAATTASAPANANSSSKARADAARQRLIEAKRNAALAKQKEATVQIVDIVESSN